MPDIIARPGPEHSAQTLCPLDSVQVQSVIIWVFGFLAVSDEVDCRRGL